MKRLFLVHLVVLHTVLLVVAVRGNVLERIRPHLRAGETPAWIASEWFIQQETDVLVPAGATIFLGDSIIGRMPASAGAVVLRTGATDFMQNRPIDYGRVLAAIPPVPMVLSSSVTQDAT